MCRSFRRFQGRRADTGTFFTEKMAWLKILYLRTPCQKLKKWLFRAIGIILVSGKTPFLKFFIQIKNCTTMAKSLSIKPLADRVIVKPAAAEEKTKGGIIIPDTAQEKPQKGVVVAAGPGKKDEPVTVKEGDTVLYGKYAGSEITFEGEDYLIMRESDILAVI